MVGFINSNASFAQTRQSQELRFCRLMQQAARHISGSYIPRGSGFCLHSAPHRRALSWHLRQRIVTSSSSASPGRSSSTSRPAASTLARPSRRYRCVDVRCDRQSFVRNWCPATGRGNRGRCRPTSRTAAQGRRAADRVTHRPASEDVAIPSQSLAIRSPEPYRIGQRESEA